MLLMLINQLGEKQWGTQKIFNVTNVKSVVIQATVFMSLWAIMTADIKHAGTQRIPQETS